MESYFSVEHCLGPFSGLDESRLHSAINSLTATFGPTEISSLWEDFSFMDSLLEQAAEEVGGEDIVWTENVLWLEAVRRNVANVLIRAATSVYLKESFEATQLVLDGKSRIFSGGQTWDGFTTEVAEHIRFIRCTGLDVYLSKTS